MALSFTSPSPRTNGWIANTLPLGEDNLNVCFKFVVVDS